MHVIQVQQCFPTHATVYLLVCDPGNATACQFLDLTLPSSLYSVKPEVLLTLPSEQSVSLREYIMPVKSTVTPIRASQSQLRAIAAWYSFGKGFKSATWALSWIPQINGVWGLLLNLLARPMFCSGERGSLYCPRWNLSLLEKLRALCVLLGWRKGLRANEGCGLQGAEHSSGLSTPAISR